MNRAASSRGWKCSQRRYERRQKHLLASSFLPCPSHSTHGLGWCISAMLKPSITFYMLKTSSSLVHIFLMWSGSLYIHLLTGHQLLGLLMHLKNITKSLLPTLVLIVAGCSLPLVTASPPTVVNGTVSPWVSWARNLAVTLDSSLTITSHGWSVIKTCQF